MDLHDISFASASASLLGFARAFATRRLNSGRATWVVIWCESFFALNHQGYLLFPLNSRERRTSCQAILGVQRRSRNEHLGIISFLLGCFPWVDVSLCRDSFELLFFSAVSEGCQDPKKTRLSTRGHRAFNATRVVCCGARLAQFFLEVSPELLDLAHWSVVSNGRFSQKTAVMLLEARSVPSWSHHGLL